MRILLCTQALTKTDNVKQKVAPKPTQNKSQPIEPPAKHWPQVNPNQNFRPQDIGQSWVELEHPDNDSSDYTVINTMSSSSQKEIGINEVKTVTP